jgi:hypothetical protein
MKPMARLFEEAFRPSDPPLPSAAKTLSRLRRKLWELPPNWHCPLIGTCLTVADLRHLAKRGGITEANLPDYALHALVVDLCGRRTDVAQLLQRFLDQRHALIIQEFAKAKSGQDVLALWQKALDTGNVAGGLWAAWMHPDTYEYEGTKIYGELHMLSHQVGAQARAEKRRLLALEQENTLLRSEAGVMQQNLAALQGELRTITDLLHASQMKLELQDAQCRRDELALATARQTAASSEVLLRRNETLSQRLMLLEQRDADRLDRISELEMQLAQARRLPRIAEPLPDNLVTDTLPRLATAEVPDPSVNVCLLGRRVLCIGGRTGLIEHYRRLVEESGGQFIHHDGGQEDNEHRIDAVISGVDVVVCHVGHVSHPAYWRVKNACKQRGLPCLFLKSGGVTSFARHLEQLANESIGNSNQAARALV